MIKNIKKRLKNQRGLTLVELLAVIVILGIVSAIAIPSIGGIIAKSKDDAIKSDALQVLNAAKLYTASNTVPTGGITLDNNDTTTGNAYGTLDGFLDIKSGTSYSITIGRNNNNFAYTNIKVIRDGRQINASTDSALLDGTAGVSDVSGG